MYLHQTRTNQPEISALCSHVLGLNANKTLWNNSVKLNPHGPFHYKVSTLESVNTRLLIHVKREVIIRLDWTCSLRFFLEWRADADIRGAFWRVTQALWAKNRQLATVIPQRWSASLPVTTAAKTKTTFRTTWAPWEADTVTNSAVQTLCLQSTRCAGPGEPLPHTQHVDTVTKQITENRTPPSR